MSPIGIFDSGYGGLTILNEIRQQLPAYDYLYLGDNARAPYGPRSFEVIYTYTLQAVEHLFERGCQLVILACNTASAKALRTIQRHDLTRWGTNRRVLGIIRPTTEVLGTLTHSGHVGLLATSGTVNSRSYDLEVARFFPHVVLTSMACPMWVHLVENNEFNSPGADYFVQKNIEGILRQDPLIDTLLLGCTHYPLLLSKIKQYTPHGIRLVTQGEYVAKSLDNYLHCHPEMAARLSQNGTCAYLTTESPQKFHESASLFLGNTVTAEHIELK